VYRRASEPPIAFAAPLTPQRGDSGELRFFQRPHIVRKVAMLLSVFAAAFVTWKTSSDAATVAHFLANGPAAHASRCCPCATD
jgi:hypothetical protein